MHPRTDSILLPCRQCLLYKPKVLWTTLAVNFSLHLAPSGIVCVCVCARARIVCVYVCVRAQSCLTLCDLMDCSPPGSSVHGIFQARNNWRELPFLSPGDRPDPGIESTFLVSPALAGRVFTTCATWGTNRHST